MIRGSDVTVVMPTITGREELLRRARRSIDAQTVAPGAVVEVWDEQREGAAKARNRGIEHVQTDWIAWLDDDDELLPNHIKVLVAGANRSKADLVFSYAEFVGGRDPLACCSDLGQLIAKPLQVPFGKAQERWLRDVGNFIPVTYLVRASLVRKVGGFPEPYSFPAVNSGDCEDYGLLLKLLDAGAKFHHVLGVRTWRYHYWAGNLGGRGVNRLHELGQ